MRLLWKRSNDKQLDLLGIDAVASEALHPRAEISSGLKRDTNTSAVPLLCGGVVARTSGQVLILPISALEEDPANPRTEFPESDIDELADDIRQHGVLQPIVVHPADANGRYRIHFGAKRLRAAQRAGLQQVPVVIRDAPADPYAQVAENQKRHGLTPLDLARFIRGRVNAGESNATIAKRLGMNLTTVAHHLALLDLPPALEQALKSGRCTSPRTLHELSTLHEERPEQVRALVAGDAQITRTTVAAVRASPTSPTPATSKSSQPTTPLARAHAACDRLEHALEHIKLPAHGPATADLIALRQRIADLATRWLQGV
jgi:ParB family chromosome partitioning protein